jgi:deoxycytidine triphosphate deaminase
MVLNDAEVAARAAAGLLTDYDASLIRNCGYTLRAGAAFDPGTGKELVLKQMNPQLDRLVWELGPGETLIVMTRERVTMPDSLCALYAPLHRLAQRGVMLLNPAVVEPGYEGPLSCFLVNFSTQRVQIAPNDPVSKIVFHVLSAAPASLKPMKFETDKYQVELSRFASRYPRSFLDMGSIEERAVQRARESVKHWVIGGGVLVGFLVLFSTLEPLTSKFILERTGVVTATQRTEDAMMLKALQDAKEHLEAAKAAESAARKSEALEKELAALRAEIVKLRQSRGAR